VQQRVRPHPLLRALPSPAQARTHPRACRRLRNAV
jgi:hypothetical protein